MIKQILFNEIKDLIGHTPTPEEYKSAIEHIKFYYDEKHTLTDIELTLRDWRDDKCKQCDVCGDYFLAEQIEKREHYRAGEINVCSDYCFNNYDY